MFLTALAYSLLCVQLANATSYGNVNRTIILIDGDPYMVDLESNGDVIDQIAQVPEYFESKETHEEILEEINEDYENEKDNIKSRLLIFPEGMSIMDSVAVDHVRDLARIYHKGYISNVHITAAHVDDFSDEALAAQRVDVIFHMLRDFGVNEEGITADMKEYSSDLPNVYVQLKIE